MDGGHGDHEPHPVHGGDHPAAPRLGEVNAGLRLDQRHVGGGVGLRTQVVLIHVGQSVAFQRGHPGLGHLGVAEVAAVGDQQRRHRDLQVGQPRIRAGDADHDLITTTILSPQRRL